MNNIIILLACILGTTFPVKNYAQTNQPIPVKPADKKTNTPIVVKSTQPIFTDNFGQTFNSIDLSHMPFRNINSVANTVAGVNSYGGGVPNIKGAPTSGTAYFIDGVRIRGAIPNLR